MQQLHEHVSNKENKTNIKSISFLCGVRPTNPCALYRVQNIVEGLLEKGINCNIFYRDIDILNSGYLTKIYASDIVVIYRERYKLSVKYIIDECRERKIPLIYDCDDLVFDVKYIDSDPTYKLCLDGKASAYGESKEEQIDNYLEGIKQSKEALLLCNYFTSPSKELCRIVGGYSKLSFHIKNTINREELRITDTLIKHKLSKDKVTIGYFSGSNSHNNDFELVIPSLLEIFNNYKNVDLYIKGSLKLPDNLEAYKDRINFDDTVCNHTEMYRHLNNINITLAPLQEGMFNDCKSNVKIMESALVAIPTIASNVKSYNDDYGILVDGEDWYNRLEYYINNKNIREMIGYNERERFIKNYYIHNEIDNIIDIYEMMLE